MASDLYIIGTSGLAKEVALLARRIDPGAKRWRCIHYVTNDAAELGLARPFGVVDTLDDALLVMNEDVDVVIGVGHAGQRKKIATVLQGAGNLNFPNLVHPRVELDLTLVSMGVGNIVTQGVVLTCDIVLGNYNLLNWNVTIGHDCRVGSFNVINPASSISGNVVIGDACLVGTGARILEGCSISSGVTIGAGAVLTRSINTVGGTYVGIPARKITI